jgi:hypothetical protein
MRAPRTRPARSARKVERKTVRSARLRQLVIATIAFSASLLSGAVALGAPAVAQTPVDDTTIVVRANNAVAQLQAYLDKVAKNHGRPDFTRPPASGLFSRIFDFGKLAALPAPSAGEFSWLVAWAEAANQAADAVFFFGFTPPAKLFPISDADRATMQRNNVEFEDQEVLATTFMVRIAAREAQTMFLVVDTLTPMQRMQFDTIKERQRSAGAMHNALRMLASDRTALKPANERMLSAAIGDTTDVWVKDILASDRLYVTIQAAKAQSTVKDDTAKQNLAVFRAAMEAALSPGERASELLRN